MNNNQISLSIPNWTNNINKKFLCPKYGNNISPSVSWNINSTNNSFNIESFALILQDIHPVANNHIHWYIPFIDKSLNSIGLLSNNTCAQYNNITSTDLLNCYKQYPDIKVKQGLNTNKLFGYYGPCAPKIEGESVNQHKHEYIFYFYALNCDLLKHLAQKNKNQLNNIFNPKTSEEFESILKSNNVEFLKTSLSGFFNPLTDLSGGTKKNIKLEIHLSNNNKKIKSNFDYDNDFNSDSDLDSHEDSDDDFEEE